MHGVRVGGLCARARAYPEEQQHTEPRTGLLVWDSGKALAALLLAYPELTAGVHCSHVTLLSVLHLSTQVKNEVLLLLLALLKENIAKRKQIVHVVLLC